MSHQDSPNGAEQGFLRDLETADFGDGLAMQVYGPDMRNAYVGLGFVRGHPDFTDGRY